MKNFPQHCPYKKFRTEGTDHSMTIPTKGKGKRWCSWAVCFSLSDTLLFFLPLLNKGKRKEVLGGERFFRRPFLGIIFERESGLAIALVSSFIDPFIRLLPGVGLRLSWARAFTFTFISFLLTRTMCSLSILNALFGMTICMISP
jgi:hypothetical protein